MSAFSVSGVLMVTLSFLSTTLPPCAHKAQYTQALPSPEACPSAKPPGVLFFFIALAYSRNSSVLVGNLGKPAFFEARSLKKGGLPQIPHQDRRVPRIRQGDEEEQHAGRLRAWACFGRRQCLGVLGLVGARRQRRRQERQGDHQHAGDREGAHLRQTAV